jgi:hypothetical protein
MSQLPERIALRANIASKKLLSATVTGLADVLSQIPKTPDPACVYSQISLVSIDSSSIESLLTEGQSYLLRSKFDRISWLASNPDTEPVQNQKQDKYKSDPAIGQAAQQRRRMPNFHEFSHDHTDFDGGNEQYGGRYSNIWLKMPLAMFRPDPP